MAMDVQHQDERRFNPLMTDSEVKLFHLKLRLEFLKFDWPCAEYRCPKCQELDYFLGKVFFSFGNLIAC